MEKNPMEKAPEEKEAGGISRRKFLKTMGLGGGAALLLGMLGSENAPTAILFIIY